MLIQLVSALVCVVVEGTLRKSSKIRASFFHPESHRDVRLSTRVTENLDALKAQLLFSEDGYDGVIDWLLENVDASHERISHQKLSDRMVPLAHHGAELANHTENLQKQGCLFDDQLFGMNPTMKAALQKELITGPLAQAAQYVRDHPNDGWMHCAYNGETCACSGRVRFGEYSWLGPAWSEPILVAGSVECSPATFHFTISNPKAGTNCQCAWDTEKHHQPSIQLRFNSWSYAQEAWIFLLRTLAQAKWLPWSGDRHYQGSTLFGVRGGGIFDRVWIHKWLDTVGQEYVQKYLGSRSVNCLEWDPVFYVNKFHGCAASSYNLWYVSDPQQMRVEGKTIYADILKLPQTAGTLKLDLVIATQVWEHLAQPMESVQALYEAMSPGGVLLFAVPFVAPVHGAPEDYWRYTKSGVAHVLEQAGFCVPRSAMAGGGDFIYSIGLNAGLSSGDFSHDELLNSYFRGFAAIPDGALEIFAVGLKKQTSTDVCPA